MLKNFITIITRPTKISYQNSSKGKKKHLTNFFNENIKDIKKSWIGIKSLVSMKQKSNDTPALTR